MAAAIKKFFFASCSSKRKMNFIQESLLEPLGGLSKMSKRQLGFQILNFAMIVCSALMVWKGMSVVTNSESPIVVVLSASMEPALQRGDLLLLTMTSEPVEVGDICVFKLKGRDVPIVHRVIKLHEPDKEGKQLILTKGDNNQVDDRSLYNPGQVWIHREDIIGRAKVFVPYAGMLTIIMNDYPSFKFVLLGGLALFVLITRE